MNTAAQPIDNSSEPINHDDLVFNQDNTKAGISGGYLALDIPLALHDDRNQNSEFRKLILKTLGPVMAVMLIMSLLPEVTIEKEKKEEVVAKIMLDPEQKPIERKPKPKPKPIEKQVAKKKSAKDRTGEQKPKQGIAALSQQLASLQGAVNLGKFKQTKTAQAKVKTQKKSRSVLGQNSASKTTAGLVSSAATINSSASQLASHKSTEIDSPILAIEVPNERQKAYAAAKAGMRDGESIRRTFERFKGSVFSIYMEESRKNPDLAGKFTFSLNITPDGAVKGIKLVSSELNAPGLEKRMLERIKLINFGKEDVMTTPVEYTYIFLPS